MKPYQNPNGKGLWSNFWGDKVKTKIKRVFKKSMRQLSKNIIRNENKTSTN